MFNILFILLFSTSVYANSIEFIGGGVTYHTFVDSSITKNFTDKLTNDGRLIYNPLYGVSYTQNNSIAYQSYKFFLGHNSIGENIGGIGYSFGFTFDHLDAGLLTGVYKQDGELFGKKEIYLWMANDYIPLVGFEFNYKIMITNSKFIKLNNYLSPIITNHTISIGENF